MPICPRHNKEMPPVFRGVEFQGEGWNRVPVYYEDHLCPECKFRVRNYFRIIHVGGGEDLRKYLSSKGLFTK